MRQMFAASSSIATMGGSRRPPAARRGAARRASRCRSARRSAGRPPTGIRTAGTACRGWPANRARVEHRQPAAAGRGDPGHDLLVVQALGRGPGGLVDAVAGLGGAVLRAAQRRSPAPGTRRLPAARRESASAGSSSQRDTSRSVRPEAAAASSRLVSRSWAAGPQMSRLVLVVDGEDEVAGEPVGGLDAGQRGQQVPPPALSGGGDALRVEQPHARARGGAQLGGGGPQVGLVAGRDDRRRGRTARTGCRGRWSCRCAGP